MNTDTDYLKYDSQFYEAKRSSEQDFTFTAMERTFERYGVELKIEDIGLIQYDGLFTNLARIVSDQCTHTVKVAVFSDDANTTFRDSREFGGSVFTQLEDTFSYLMLCNRTNAVFKGLERIERRDYPEEALREALINALVHRDYSYSGSIIININEERMEFISIGGLLPGLTADDIRLGISQPRNKNLADIFHRIHLAESYGTGIRRIYELYAGYPVQPEIEVTNNAFKMVLPNMNASSEKNRKVKPKVTGQMSKVLDFIEANGQITEPEIGELLKLKKTRTYTLAREMKDLGLIFSEGRGPEKRYYLK